jgi:sulfatase maturation enzyme AslB (radical SAM superfamily)
MEKIFELDSSVIDMLFAGKHVTNVHDKSTAPLPKNIFNYFLILSYTCNLKCIYCFEKEKIAHYDMPFSIIQKMLQAIELNTNPSACIVLYGGEPLLEKIQTK